MPNQLFMKHRYIRYLQEYSVPATTVPTSFVFRVNGMYDPDVTATGHQPYYYDQIKELYNHWTVLSSSIKITAQVVSESAPLVANSCSGVLYIEDDTTVSPTSIAQAAELPSAGPYQIIGYNQEPKVFRRSWNARQAYGGDTMDNANLRGNAGSDPLEQQTFTFSVVAPAAQSCVIAFTAEIVYNVVWTELIPVVGS
ncbi:hypothetical protein [Candidatus Magnetobacterium casense]|uniref:Capsid protein n=1 Tax=Candidatus Magnetobacterium casense TaxID=1455061 RepID=A0ABS6S4B1_9BACT|nr:hypothetical protein [Candidatus Magnetobacterium casensis]MBV6343692.1 hypothetical protein [Candidatus Magnetobacterium casensis]